MSFATQVSMSDSGSESTWTPGLDAGGGATLCGMRMEGGISGKAISGSPGSVTVSLGRGSDAPGSSPAR